MNEESDPYQQVDQTTKKTDFSKKSDTQKTEEEDSYQNSIDISYKNIKPPEWIKAIELFCQRLLKKLDMSNWEVSLLICDDTFIRELNEKYRAINNPTDVLAFPGNYCPGRNIRFPGYNNSPGNGEIEFLQNTQSEIIYAGDIVISLPTCVRNAYHFHIHREEELKRLIIHGILHLMGMDHTGEGGDMLVLQEKLLKDLMGG